MEGNDKDNNFKLNNRSKYKNRRRFPFIIVIKDLLGKPVFKIGIFSFLFGIPFAIGFLPHSGLLSTSFNDDDPVTTGVITGAIGTDAKAGDVEIFEYKYQFKLDDEKFYTGKGYSTGNTMERGDGIKILYKQKDPSKSKGVDLRTSILGGWAVFFRLQFLGFGLIILFFGMRKTLRQISILKIGEIADAKLLNKKATNMKIDRQTVYALTFEFTASDSKIYRVVYTLSAVKNITDEGYEMLVYDPDRPEKAVLLDQLPKGIKNLFLRMV
jgi:hypothetical protein